MKLELLKSYLQQLNRAKALLAVELLKNEKEVL